MTDPQAKPSALPSWVDMPEADGLYVRSAGGKNYELVEYAAGSMGWLALLIVSQFAPAKRGRWYGPIPKDNR